MTLAPVDILEAIRKKRIVVWKTELYIVMDWTENFQKIFLSELANDDEYDVITNFEVVLSPILGGFTGLIRSDSGIWVKNSRLRFAATDDMAQQRGGRLGNKLGIT